MFFKYDFKIWFFFLSYPNDFKLSSEIGYRRLSLFHFDLQIRLFSIVFKIGDHFPSPHSPYTPKPCYRSFSSLKFLMLDCTFKVLVKLFITVCENLLRFKGVVRLWKRKFYKISNSIFRKSKFEKLKTNVINYSWPFRKTDLFIVFK